jgi:hypothetical protein
MITRREHLSAGRTIDHSGHYIDEALFAAGLMGSDD